MSVKMGRPISQNPKKTNVACRLTSEEVIMIEECCEVLKTDKSTVLRKGLQLVYESIKE